MSKEFSFGKLDFKLTAGLDGPLGVPEPDAPFRVAIIGDFSGAAKRGDLSARRPLLADRDNFDRVIARLGPQLRLGNPSIGLQFSELDDFHPDRILDRVDLFQSLKETRTRLGHPSTFQSAAAEVRRWVGAEAAPDRPEAERAPAVENISPASLLDKMLDETEVPSGKESALPSDLQAFLQQIVRPHLAAGDDPQQAQLTAYVDETISALMSAMLHHPDFQALESLWRAAYFLVSGLETGTDLKLYLLDISKAELASDLFAVEDLKSTAIYRLLVEQTVGTPGGEPWAMIIGDFSFDRTLEDVELLGRVAKIARKAGAPLIAAAGPTLLGCDSVAATPDPADWRASVDADADRAWQALRELEEATSVGLALPRFLLRLPYGKETEPTEEFDFEETAGGTTHEDYLWGNAAFACGLLLGQSFSHHGWGFRPGVIKDIEGLPVHIYEDQGETAVKPCAEVLLTERAAQAIIDSGLMPLLSFKGRDLVRLARFQSIALTPSPLAGRWS